MATLEEKLDEVLKAVKSLGRRVGTVEKALKMNTAHTEMALQEVRSVSQRFGLVEQGIQQINIRCEQRLVQCMPDSPNADEGGTGGVSGNGAGEVPPEAATNGAG